ncbi:MAG: 30S ribosomal protein S6, partial [Okeania sp. SIO3H1]|nr:30S ribosomal protein S6 [Okeania sp. SIO3H1]
VAEGEVADVATAIRSSIESVGGTITNEEEPARFDLAYDIVKYLEGRNRKFSSAYFGWMRFTAEPAKLAEITETVEAMPQLLRHLVIKLTKAEEEHVFMFHEALADTKSETVDLDAATPAPEAEAKEETKEAEETPAEPAAESEEKTEAAIEDSSEEAETEVK